MFKYLSLFNQKSTVLKMSLTINKLQNEINNTNTPLKSIKSC